MESSFPFSLDLNLAPPTQTWGQGTASVWMPYFASSRGPVTVNDSILLDNDVSLGVARNLVTPRDVRVLGTKDDNRVVSDAMALSVQSAAYVASVGHRLIVKSREVEILRAHLVANRRQLKVLQEENKQLSKMVNFYSQDMRKQVDALERLGDKRKHVIFGSSSDEPQDAVLENPEDNVQKAKQKAHMVETEGAVKK